MRKSVNRSPLFYVGDKYKLIEEIKTFFPPAIGTLFEPFVGGGSVFMNVDADRYVLNDIDTNVIDIHRMLCRYADVPEELFEKMFNIIRRYGLSCSYLGIDVPPELKREYVKTYYARYNKSAYINLRNDYNSKGSKDIIELYILLIYGFNRLLRFNKKGDFNLPVGNVDFNSNTYDALLGYLHSVRSKTIEWQSMDFREFFAKNEISSNDLIYLDPPYLITFSEYNKLWNEDTEHDLLGLLDNLSEQGLKFAISNVTHYKGRTNSIFLKWSEKYSTHQIKSNYISFRDNTIKDFDEVLVTNY